MKIINLGILGHVDAGKTTLTESLLYTSGAIAELGSVDEGTTRTDTMNLERQRGITIQTAVTSFQWEDVKVNIIDTPGHMDFLAEVYRVSATLNETKKLRGRKLPRRRKYGRDTEKRSKRKPTPEDFYGRVQKADGGTLQCGKVPYRNCKRI